MDQNNIDNYISFIKAFLDAADHRSPAASILFPETAEKIRVLVGRLEVLEAADRKRRDHLRGIAARGGRKGGTAKTERKRAASRANILEGRQSGRRATSGQPD